MATAAENTVDLTLDPHSDQFKIRSFEDAVAWMTARNPNMEQNRPQDLDWQAIKSNARKWA